MPSFKLTGMVDVLYKVVVMKLCAGYAIALGLLSCNASLDRRHIV